MELKKIDDVADYIAEEPWSMYWTEFKSGSDAFESFLHDPLTYFIENIEEVDKSWKVQMDIVGHEHGLMSSAVCKISLAIPKYKMVKTTLYKHDPETNQ